MGKTRSSFLVALLAVVGLLASGAGTPTVGSAQASVKPPIALWQVRSVSMQKARDWFPYGAVGKSIRRSVCGYRNRSRTRAVCVMSVHWTEPNGLGCPNSSRPGGGVFGTYKFRVYYQIFQTHRGNTFSTWKHVYSKGQDKVNCADRDLFL